MNKKIFLFLFSIILLTVFSLNVFAISLNQVETNSVALNHNKGTAGIDLINSGNNLLMFGRFDDTYPNQVSFYQLGDTYNISTMAWLFDFDLSTKYPSQYQNYTLAAAYLTDNNQNLYLVLQNSTNNQPSVNFAIIHYNWTTTDLNDLTYSDSINTTLTVANGGIPAIDGIWVNNAGTLMVISGLKLITVSSIPFRQAYTISNNVVSLSNPTSLPVSFQEGSVTGGASNANIFISPDTTFLVDIQRLTNTGVIQITIQGNSSANIANFNTLPNPRGIEVFYLYGNPYLLTENAGTLYKYSITGINAPIPEQSNTNLSQGQDTLVNGFIQPLINLFPDANSISFGNKLAIVFVVMLLIAIAILYLGSGATEGVHTLLLYIVAILEIFAFFFFVAISYIPLSWVIVIVVVTGIFIALRIKGGS